MSEVNPLPYNIADVKVEVDVDGDGNNEAVGEEAEKVNFDSDVELLRTVARLLRSGSWISCSLEVRDNFGEMLVDLGESLKGFEKLYRCNEEKNRELMEQVQGWTMRCQVLEGRLEQGQRSQQEGLRKMREEHTGELARIRMEFKIKLEGLSRVAQQGVLGSALDVEEEPRSNPIQDISVSKAKETDQKQLGIPNLNRERNFLCPICTKSYFTSQDLTRHVATHRSDRPIKCPQCPQRFKVADILRKHLVTHSERRPFQCELCEKNFRRSGELKMHLRVHTGERPYSCQICRKAFTQSANLKKHVRTHQGGDGRIHPTNLTGLNEKSQLITQQAPEGEFPEAPMPTRQAEVGTVSSEYGSGSSPTSKDKMVQLPIECPQFSKQFKFPSKLRLHLVVHSEQKPFQCELCEKRFKRSFELVQHRRVHTGERPYSCKLFGKAYTQPGSLRDHLWTHQEDKGKIHECPICKIKFTRKSHVRNHQQRLHKSELASQE